jgi:protein FAM50
LTTTIFFTASQQLISEDTHPKILCSYNINSSILAMAHYKGAASEAGRALQLLKKREIAQQEIEFRKKKIEEDLKISNIENKFATHYDAVEQQLKTSTIGLVTLDEMKAKQEDIVREREKKKTKKK